MDKETLQFQIKENLSLEEKGAVMELWNQEYPATLCYVDLTEFEKYLSGLGLAEHILVKVKSNNNAVVGWATKFHREGRRWFVIILSSSIHRQRVGSVLINSLKQGEEELYGWVIDHDRDIKTNGHSYHSPIGFYSKHGFDILIDQRLELVNISAVKIRWQDKNHFNKREFHGMNYLSTETKL